MENDRHNHRIVVPKLGLIESPFATLDNPEGGVKGRHEIGPNNFVSLPKHHGWEVGKDSPGGHGGPTKKVNPALQMILSHK